MFTSLITPSKPLFRLMLDEVHVTIIKRRRIGDRLFILNVMYTNGQVIHSQKVFGTPCED